MTTTERPQPRPLVLLVEDHEESLRTRSALFREAGCAVIGVRSSDSAVRELSASPQVNLVVTDIHLSPRPEDDDRSGVALARYVRKARPGLPVAGYSAHFSEDSLSSEDLAVFDASFGRGSQSRRQLADAIDECKTLAVQHRERRQADAARTLDDLRRRHERQRPGLEVVRRMRVGLDGLADVESALNEAGYRLRLVTADDAAGAAEPFIVWLVEDEGLVQAEVYGHPELYAVGQDEEAAIADLVELMHLFADDLQEEATGPALELRVFLRRVLLGER